tara:strand:- start:374 stop:1258 length:885 start_codon:yes stop_codon:yes gene_type:complete
MAEKEDYLDVDPPLTGQNWTCISFVSPEKILVNKNVWLFQKFMTKFCEEEKYKYEELKGKYDDFMYANENRLEKEFHEENNNQTTVRGVKVRGCFDTRREAEVRSEVLRRLNSNHHIFVGQVGYWLPWDPSADNVADQKFQEESLNDLVGKQKENQEQRDMFYEERKREQIKELEEENRKLKEKNKIEKDKIDAENKVKEEERIRLYNEKMEAEKAKAEEEAKKSENEENRTEKGKVDSIGEEDILSKKVENEKVENELVEKKDDSVGEEDVKNETKSYLEFEDSDPWMKRHGK